MRLDQAEDGRADQLAHHHDPVRVSGYEHPTEQSRPPDLDEAGGGDEKGEKDEEHQFAAGRVRVRAWKISSAEARCRSSTRSVWWATRLNADVVVVDVVVARCCAVCHSETTTS